MDEFEFKTELRERNLAVDYGDVIGGPFIPDGLYRVYETETNGMICSSKTYEGLIEAFSIWLQGRR